MNRRSLTAGVAASLVALATTAGVTLAAVQRATLSVEAGPPGTEVTLRVEMTARIAGTNEGLLLLVPVAAFEAAPEAARCEAIDGSTKLAAMAWNAATVEFSGTSYAGLVGEAIFTVPDVPVGAYFLAESIDATGTGCHTFAAFSVTAAGLPDTAMADDKNVAAVGLALLLLAAAIAAARRRPALA